MCHFLLVLTAESDVQLHVSMSNGWRDRVIGRAKVWLDILSPTIKPNSIQRGGAGLGFTLHPWLCIEPLLFNATVPLDKEKGTRGKTNASYYEIT